MANSFAKVLQGLTLNQFCEVVRTACLGEGPYHPHEIAEEVKRRIEKDTTNG